MADYQTVDSHGLDIHYRVFGDGEPLLIIGGGPGDNSDRYLSLCELLSSDFKCILVDQRGSGKSSPDKPDSSNISISLTLDDFEVIRKDLGLKKWHVLGFSYGGFLGSLYTHFFPESTISLILLDSMGLNLAAFGHFSDNIFSRMNSEDHEKYDYWNKPEKRVVDSNHALVERIRAMMPGYFYDRKKSLLVSEEMKDSDFNLELGNFIWPDIEKRKLDLTKKVAKFKGPILILHGRQDPLGESIAELIHNHYINSELVYIEKAGHYSWIEQPVIVYDHITAFMDKQTPSFPKLSGPYLGQKLPGLKPEPFASGLLSTENEVEINSEFSSDGKEFYYVTREQNSDRYDLMFTKMADGIWTKPKRLFLVESNYSVADVALSPDDKRLYFCSEKPELWDSAEGFDIWYVERTDNGWSEPVNAGKNINSDKGETQPSFTSDGSMYFPSNRKGSNDSVDLYYARYTNGKFAKAVPMSSNINSKYNEGNSFIAPDGSFIIFARWDMPKKVDGGKAAYISFKRADGSWTKPVNSLSTLGLYGSLAAVTPDNKYLLFSSYKGIHWVDIKVLDKLKKQELAR